MSKIKSFFNFSNISGFSDFQRFVSQFLQVVFETINGQIEFSDNIRSSPLMAEDFVSGTTYTIPHSLGIVPRGIIVVNVDGPYIIYGDKDTWTSSNIYLQSNGTVTASFYIV